MKTLTKMLAGAAGVAAVATAAPAAAQYAYQYNPYANYGYSQPNGYAYGNPYGYANAYGAVNTNAAAQQCSAAVQNRLASRQNIGSVIASLLGANTSPRVVSITQVTPRRNSVTVRGLASTGRMAYSPYGVGAYGALGGAYPPALSFKCSVDYRGYVRDVSITRR